MKRRRKISTRDEIPEYINKCIKLLQYLAHEADKHANRFVNIRDERGDDFEAWLIEGIFDNLHDIVLRTSNDLSITDAVEDLLIDTSKMVYGDDYEYDS